MSQVKPDAWEGVRRALVDGLLAIDHTEIDAMWRRYWEEEAERLFGPMREVDYLPD